MLRRSEWRLKLTYICSIGLIVVICVFNYVAVRDMNGNADRLADEMYPMDRTAKELRLAVVNQESGIRGLLLSDDRTYLSDYETGSADVERYSAELREQANDTSVRPLADATLTSLIDVQQLFRNVVGLFESSDEEKAKSLLVGGKTTLDQFRTATDRLNAALSESMQSTWEAQSRRASMSQEMIVVTVVVALLAIGLHGLLFRTTKQALRLTIESERRYRRLIDSSPDAIAVHQGGIIAFANPACLTLMGVSHTSDLVGQSIMRFVPAHLAEVVARRAQSAMKENEVGALDEQFVRPDGSVVDVEVTAIGIPYMGRPAVLIVCRDIGPRKEAERKMTEANALLQRLSQLDGLTGIPNRRSFDEQLQHCWSEARERRGNASLILLDVDSFKEYNDHYGHQRGDACLQTIAGIVEDEARKADGTAYRYGGEEFAVLLPGCDRESGKAAADLIRQAVAGVGIPHEGAGNGATVTISVGVATATSRTDGYASMHGWLQAADQALYQAKRRGRNSTVEASAS
ncbi:diguanylate cyclase domain-containing protein [Cohnella sp. GCM10027633]|uniref:GGDEF domain-containing protein n=1 Tax=unclassified Cohnella TaxID=2636738 RepID=UPI00362B2AAB